MPLLNKLCCGCRSRKTSLLSAFYSISMAVTCLSLMLLQHSAKKNHAYVKDPAMLSYISLGVYGMLIVFSFILVAGANLSKVCVCIPWVLNMVAVVVFEAATTGARYISSYHHHKHVRPWDTFCIVFYIIRTFCNMYFIVSVCVQCYCSLQPEDEEEKAEENKDIYTIEDPLPGGLMAQTTLCLPERPESERMLEAAPLYQRLPPVQPDESQWENCAVSVEEKKILIDSDEEDNKYDCVVESMDIDGL